MRFAGGVEPCELGPDAAGADTEDEHAGFRYRKQIRPGNGKRAHLIGHGYWFAAQLEPVRVERRREQRRVAQKQQLAGAAVERRCVERLTVGEHEWIARLLIGRVVDRPDEDPLPAGVVADAKIEKVPAIGEELRVPMKLAVQGRRRRGCGAARCDLRGGPTAS